MITHALRRCYNDGSDTIININLKQGQLSHSFEPHDTDSLNSWRSQRHTYFPAKRQAFRVPRFPCPDSPRPSTWTTRAGNFSTDPSPSEWAWPARDRGDVHVGTTPSAEWIARKGEPVLRLAGPIAKERAEEPSPMAHCIRGLELLGRLEEDLHLSPRITSAMRCAMGMYPQKHLGEHRHAGCEREREPFARSVEVPRMAPATNGSPEKRTGTYSRRPQPLTSRQPAVSKCQPHP
jgi:hypothetical protein